MVRLAPCGCMRQPPPLQLRGGMGWSKPEMIPKPSSAPRPVPGIMRHRPSKQEMAAGALTGGGGAGGGGRCNETSNGVRANTEAPSTLSARPSISTLANATVSLPARRTQGGTRPAPQPRAQTSRPGCSAMPHPPLPIARRSWLRLRSTGAQQLQEVQVSIFLSKHRCVAPGVVCCAHVGTAV